MSSEQIKKVRKEQSKASVVGFSVIGLLFLLAYSYFEFLGWMFMSKGNALLSLGLMCLVAFILVLTSFALPRIKNSNDAKMAKRRTFRTVLVMVVFFGTALFSFVGVLHFFKVQKNEDLITQMYNSAIEEARAVYPSYEKYVASRVDSYSVMLDNAIANKKIAQEQYASVLGKFPGTDDAIRKENLVNSLNRTLKPTNNQAQIQFEEWLSQAGEVNVWNVSFVNNVKVLDSKIGGFIKLLKMTSERYFHPGEEKTPFSYPAYQSSEKIQEFFQFDGIYLTKRACGIFLLTVFTLFMPWLREDIRSRKDVD